jgi:hypothetical protein
MKGMYGERYILFNGKLNASGDVVESKKLLRRYDMGTLWLLTGCWRIRGNTANGYKVRIR